MSGNVWQWCLNQYDHPEVTTVDDSVDIRVLRCGAWEYIPDAARADFLFNLHPYGCYDVIGFRVVVVVRPPS